MSRFTEAGGEMKRYDLSDGGIRGNFDLVMSEHPRGEWVKWEDVKGLIECQVLEATVCNCKEKIIGEIVEDYHFRENMAMFWFCPAHGYKKR